MNEHLPYGDRVISESEARKQIMSQYESLRHEETQHVGIGINELDQLPNEMKIFFENCDDLPDELGMHYLMHELDSDELTEITEIYAQYNKKKTIH